MKEVYGDWKKKKINEVVIDEENLYYSIEESFGPKIGWKNLDFAGFIKCITGGEPSNVGVYISIEEGWRPSRYPRFYTELLDLEQRFYDTDINFQVVPVPGKRARGKSVADQWIIRDATRILSNPITLREINTFTVVSSDWIFHPLILADAAAVGLKAKAIVCRDNFSEQKTSLPEIPGLEEIEIKYLDEILRENPKLLQKT
ncbi:MAG: NYN domain-containing protein [Minisyncoccales bacterium]